MSISFRIVLHVPVCYPSGAVIPETSTILGGATKAKVLVHPSAYGAFFLTSLNSKKEP